MTKLLPILLLLLFWLTRQTALEALPLHNDEGLHLTRALEVWQGHPFWEIRDGKIINHWLIALFYPQQEPVFMGRIATIFTGMIGLAAALALGQCLSGGWGALLAGLLWIGSTYLFFYERLAFSDAQAGALALLALWLSLRAALRGRLSDVVLASVALASALLFKFTALPFALSVTLVILFAGHSPFWLRLRQLMLIALIVMLAFIPPVLYLLVRGSDFFSIALAWVGPGGAGGLTVANNAVRLTEILVGLGTLDWALTIAVGLLFAIAWPIFAPRSHSVSRQPSHPDARQAMAVLAVAALVPLLVLLLLGREAQSRHFVVVLPALIATAGGALGHLIARLPRSIRLASATLIVVFACGSFPLFALQAYVDSGALPLPQQMRQQYVSDHSSGYGLREAVSAFSHTLVRADLPVIASMFADSCHRANFYAVHGRAMLCADVPGLPEIEAALAEFGAVYVLVERGGVIGVDVATLDAHASELAVYPRPDETNMNASVRLWLLQRSGEP